MSYPTGPEGAIFDDGAFIIGDDWGQDYTEQSVRALWTVPKPSLGTALDLLREHLLKLPLEALKGFEGLITTATEGAFNTVAGAVDAIMGAISNIPAFLRMDQWDDWLLGAWNTLERTVQQMIDIFMGVVVTPINSAVQAFKDWFFDFAGGIAATASKAQATIDSIIRGWKADYTATGSVDDVQIVLGEARQVKYGLITVADMANAPKNVPFWVSPNPFEDVSFPRSDIEKIIEYTATASSSGPSPTITVGGDWNNTKAGQYNSHTHDVSSSLTATYSRPRFTVFSGNLALSVVRMTANRIVNCARFIAGGDTPPTQVLAGLYEIDPETGNHRLIYDFGDIRSEIPTGPDVYEVSLETDGDIVVDEGALLALGILPIGGSFTVAGKSRQPIVPTVTIYPQAATELLSGQTALPETITETSLNHTAAYRMWAAIGQVLPETIIPKFLITSFDAYTNTNNWVSPAFVYRSSSNDARFKILNGVCIIDSPTYLGSNDWYKHAFAVTPCATNDMFSEILLGGNWASTSYGHEFLHVRASQDGKYGVMAEISGDGAVTIETVSNGSRTVRETGSLGRTPVAGDRIKLVAVGNVYAVYFNDSVEPSAEWEDTLGLVDVGAAWRRTGFGMHHATFGFGYYRPAGIDVWSGGDVVVSEPEEEEEPPEEEE